MRWVRIGIECESAAAEPVAAILLAGGCGGVEQDEREIAGYLPMDDSLEGKLERLRSLLDRLPPDLQPSRPSMTLRFVDEENWAEAWKAHFQPIPIGRRLLVTPSWIPRDPAAERVTVELDPGMAFGTGGHPSTRLCLRALEERIAGGETVIDWGVGSGLLAIAALKLGAARVWAGDLDLPSVRIAAENAARNGVRNRIDLVVGDRPACFGARADGVVCNILADVILSLAGDLAGVTKPGGWLIASGIIDARREEVEAGLAQAGFGIAKVETEEEWVAIHAVRAPHP